MSPPSHQQIKSRKLGPHLLHPDPGTFSPHNEQHHVTKCIEHLEFGSDELMNIQF